MVLRKASNTPKSRSGPKSFPCNSSLATSGAACYLKHATAPRVLPTYPFQSYMPQILVAYRILRSRLFNFLVVFTQVDVESLTEVNDELRHRIGVNNLHEAVASLCLELRWNADICRHRTEDLNQDTR